MFYSFYKPAESLFPICFQQYSRRLFPSLINKQMLKKKKQHSIVTFLFLIISYNNNL